VTRKGPEGSNPSPGAYFEEPNTSLKALAGESRVEEVTTTMDELTANTINQKQTMTTANIHPNSRLQEPYSSLPQKEDEIITAVNTDGVTQSLDSTTVSAPSQLDGIIDSLTQGMSRKALNTRLKALYRISPSNASTICEHILSEQTE
jgi:hypothetical protein